MSRSQMYFEAYSSNAIPMFQGYPLEDDGKFNGNVSAIGTRQNEQRLTTFPFAEPPPPGFIYSPSQEPTYNIYSNPPPYTYTRNPISTNVDTRPIDVESAGQLGEVNNSGTSGNVDKKKQYVRKFVIIIVIVFLAFALFMVIQHIRFMSRIDTSYHTPWNNYK